jgi:hypothetical protein
MYFGDHQPPHFHVEYGSDEALVSILTLGIIEGKLPPRVMGMVVEWGIDAPAGTSGRLGTGTRSSTT